MTAGRLGCAPGAPPAARGRGRPRRSFSGSGLPMDPEVPSGSASARPAERVASVRLDHRVDLEWISLSSRLDSLRVCRAPLGTCAIHRCRSVYRRATETPIAVPDSFEESCPACCVVQSCAAYAACRSSEGACDSSEQNVPGLVTVGAIATPKLEPCPMATEVAAPDATSPPALAAERASWGGAMQLHAMLEGSLA